MRPFLRATFALFLLVFAAPALAQETPPEESLLDVLARAAAMDEQSRRSGLISFVENRLSTPDRQIRITGIDGVLSSNASIAQITISDREGIWFIIENAQIEWNQGALLLGRLEIRSLTADAITYVRNPISDEDAPIGAPAPEAGGFAVPDFPVAVIIDEISVPQVTFGDDVFGLGSEISIAGAVTLDDGALDANLDIVRLDGPGGTLDLDVTYSNATEEIDLALVLTEPQNGIIANLLNIEGRPEIALSLAGAGPISDLETTLTLDADGNRVLSGTGTLAQGAEGLEVTGDVGGPIAALIPPIYRDFFGEETALSFSAVLRESGGFTIPEIRLSGGQLGLVASAETTNDGFLRRLVVDADVVSSDGEPVLLPVPGASTTVERARFAIDYGADGSEDWSGTFDIVGFATPDFSADTFTFNASGVAADLDDPDLRRVTFNGDGTLAGIATASQEVAAALGSSIGFGIAGLWESGAPIELAQLRVIGEALTFDMSGIINENTVFWGDIALVTESIAPFSGLAERELSGAVSLAANGTLSPLIGGFDLTLNGTASDLAVDDLVLDRLLEGVVSVQGRVARTGNGLEAEGFRIANDQIELTADGTYATGAADFAFDLALADLALIAEDASGRLIASGTARGSEGVLVLDANIAVPQGTVTGRPLRDARIDFQGVTQDTGLTGAVSGEAFLDGFRVALSGDIDNNPERLIVSDLLFEAPGATLRGDITRTSAGLIEGQLALDASNIETAAALALLEASGSANAQVVLSHDDDIQSAQITAALTNFVVEDARIGSANLTADIDDLFGVPSIDGALNGSDISAAGVRVETVTLRASRNGETTRFDGRASLAGNTSIALAGGLSPLEGDGYRVALDSFSLTQNQIAARLASPTALTVSGDTVAFDGVQLDVGSGRIVATGSAGENLDIALNITALPLSIANAVVPDLALAGTISGTAQVSGTASDPRAQFSIEGSGLNAAAISEFGVAPISLSAQGTYANEQIALSSLSASGAQGLNATARGTIPLSGGGLSLNVDGSVPLTLANRFLAERGAQAIGTLTLNATVTGSTDDPQFGGTLSVSGAEYIDPELNLRLQNISGSASLSATNATINSLSAQLATGGSISVSGSVGLDAPAFTSNLQIALNDARYADGTLLVATLAGNLALTGPVGQGGQLSGNILVQRADITVPESLGGGATLIEVDHRNPPPSVAATLARAGADARATTQRQAQTPLALNLTISAPNQIFIRGRGLDAEVGGQVQLGGTVDNIQPVGGFELIRGRLSILGQRIDFDSGTVTLIGDTDPFINLVARTEGEGITVFVTVSGRASAPDISFSSEPMLPQDEVLARLLFNRGVGELSPIQLAQLAAAAAELVGGGGNTSLLDSFRQAAGLDDLDIVSDEEGNVGVRAGRYIQDNVYLGVEAGGAGNGRVTIDLDITDNLRARGAAGSDGNTSIGIFYEQDY